MSESSSPERKSSDRHHRSRSKSKKSHKSRHESRHQDKKKRESRKRSRERTPDDRSRKREYVRFIANVQLYFFENFKFISKFFYCDQSSKRNDEENKEKRRSRSKSGNRSRNSKLTRHDHSDRLY